MNENTGKWAARCECYNEHASASGRCNHRNVTDPTATEPSDAVYCEGCRGDCKHRVVDMRAMRAEQAAS